MSTLLVVGEVLRPHGLGGEVVVRIVTDFPERFREGLELVWRRGVSERALRLTARRPHQDRLLLRFEGVASVEAARELAGGDLCVREIDAHPAPEGFYYGHEIAGFVCEDASGRALGMAMGLETTPAGALLRVERAGREVLVPFTRPIVVDVDRLARRIVLDPPGGLLDL